MCKTLTLGNYSIHPEYNIPVIEILVDGDNEGWLSPFRGYFFQISETYDGIHALGRSINGAVLKRFLTGDNDLDTDILSSLALTAIMDFSRIWKLHHKGESLVLDVKLMTVKHSSQFELFINETIKWINK